MRCRRALRRPETARRYSEQIAFTPEHFPQVLQPHLGADLRTIFVLGGDGTVLAVAEALQATPAPQVPLAILPHGTMNWLARDLGLPPDPAQALEALLTPVLRRIDLGRVNGQPFLCACMIGVAALLARYRERHRQQPRWRRWPGLFVQAIRLWGRYLHLRLRLIMGRTRSLCHAPRHPAAVAHVAHPLDVWEVADTVGIHH